MAIETIRLVLLQQYFGKNINNVFHYQTDNLNTDNAQRVAQAFETQILPSINSIQNNQVSNVSLYALNLDNTADYWTESCSGGGAVGGIATALTPFNAWSYTLNPVLSVIRHGYKRIVGVDETWVTQAAPLASQLAALNAVASSFKDPLTSLGWDAIPQVVRYISEDPYVYLAAEVIACIFKSWSTQNSRKF